ncbi:hypothetical protein NDU88_000263 [Pleurodeles waltl]|uniref:Uncharacterized protein n=1 Tax=Pleurodeles waltl TaxID=8319 RepID=A0AAV7TEL9_PLEWA|nr:hypothetical protein NDU88_000263 [Pleurodeles waltl]
MFRRSVGRASSEGVAAAVIACSPPVTGKKCRQKSAKGRRYAQAVAVDEEAEVFSREGLPASGGVRRSGSRLARWAGASLRQRVASGGRGAAERGAVAPGSSVGAEAQWFGHVPALKKKAGRLEEQAPLFSRNKGKQGEGVLEESTRAGTFKVAARTGDRQEPIFILSDSEGDDPVGNGGITSSVTEIDLAGRGEHSMIVQWAPSELGVPGCGKALASGGQEEQLSEAGQGRPAFISGHTVGVSTPLRHLQEERVRPGAAHPTSRESVTSSQVRKRHMNYDEPSTSQSTGGFIWDMGFEETLELDEDNEMARVGADLEDVGGQGNNQSRSFDILQGQKRAAVRSDRRVGERIVSGSAGNLPRGEERSGISGCGGRGLGGISSYGARARVQDMGVQTCNASNEVETSKVGDSEVFTDSAFLGWALGCGSMAVGLERGSS